MALYDAACIVSAHHRALISLETSKLRLDTVEISD